MDQSGLSSENAKTVVPDVSEALLRWENLDLSAHSAGMGIMTIPWLRDVAEWNPVSMLTQLARSAFRRRSRD